ncbi:hypothetical protein, partial [Enterococcus faecium]
MTCAARRREECGKSGGGAPDQAATPVGGEPEERCGGFTLPGTGVPHSRSQSNVICLNGGE